MCSRLSHQVERRGLAGCTRQAGDRASPLRPFQKLLAPSEVGLFQQPLLSRPMRVMVSDVAHPPPMPSTLPGPAPELLLQAKAKVIGRMRVMVSDVAREGRIRDSWPLLEAQVGRGSERGSRGTWLSWKVGYTGYVVGARRSNPSPCQLPFAPQTGEVHMLLPRSNFLIPNSPLLRRPARCTWAWSGTPSSWNRRASRPQPAAEWVCNDTSAALLGRRPGGHNQPLGRRACSAGARRYQAVRRCRW